MGIMSLASDTFMENIVNMGAYLALILTKSSAFFGKIKGTYFYQGFNVL